MSNDFNDQIRPRRSGEPAPKSGGNKTLLWVLLGVGALGMLVCCGGCIFSYQAGVGWLADMAVDQYQNDPVILEHIGEITDADFAEQKTGEESAKRPDALVFALTGTKGNGDIIAEQDESGLSYRDAVLRLPDGREFPLGDGFDGEIEDDFGDFDEEVDEILVDPNADGPSDAPVEAGSL